MQEVLVRHCFPGRCSLSDGDVGSGRLNARVDTPEP